MMTANPILLQKKYARVIECFAKQQGLSLDEALGLFYHSEVYQLMRDGVSDMHCMSKLYLAEELEQAIRNSLRRGDMFTRYSDNQFLMLLLGIRQEDCVIVVERINGYFEKASRKNYLKYSTAPISEIMEVDDCVHFHNMDSMWGE